MSDETTPPMPLLGGAQGPKRSSFAEAGWLFRVLPARWEAIGTPSLVRSAAVVVGSWLLLAWSRFGFQGLSAPRAGVRFILIGVYAWIGVTFALWLMGLLAGRLQLLGSSPNGGPLAKILLVTGLAFQPLVAIGVAAQILPSFPIPGLTTIVVVATFALWLPGVLAAATATIFGTSLLRGATIALVAYLGWLLTAGRFLFDQLAHLI